MNECINGWEPEIGGKAGGRRERSLECRKGLS